jgi:hypothetical protein
MRKRGTDEHRGVADHDALAAKTAHVPSQISQIQSTSKMVKLFILTVTASDKVVQPVAVVLPIFLGQKAKGKAKVQHLRTRKQIELNLRALPTLEYSAR